MCGTAGLPHVIVRFFTVPRVKDARLSAGYALVFIAILYTAVPGVAGFGRVNLIQTINGAENTGTDVLLKCQNGSRTGRTRVF